MKITLLIIFLSISSICYSQKAPFVYPDSSSMQITPDLLTRDLLNRDLKKKGILFNSHQNISSSKQIEELSIFSVVPNGPRYEVVFYVITRGYSNREMYNSKIFATYIESKKGMVLEKMKLHKHKALSNGLLY